MAGTTGSQWPTRPVSAGANVRRVRAPPGPSDPVALRPSDPADLRRRRRPNGDRCLPGASAHRPVRSGYDPFPPGVARTSQPAAAPARGPLRCLLGRRGVVLAGCGAAIPVVSASIPPRRARPTAASRAPTRISRRSCPSYQGKAPDNVDSGRELHDGRARRARRRRASTGVRFAGRDVGARGRRPGSRSPRSRATGLDPDEDDHVLRGQRATADRHTEKLSTADVTVDGQGGPAARRARAATAPGRRSSTWPADQADTVFVLLAADLGDAAVTRGARGQFAGS